MTEFITKASLVNESMNLQLLVGAFNAFIECELIIGFEFGSFHAEASVLDFVYNASVFNTSGNNASVFNASRNNASVLTVTVDDFVFVWTVKGGSGLLVNDMGVGQALVAIVDVGKASSLVQVSSSVADVDVASTVVSNVNNASIDKKACYGASTVDFTLDDNIAKFMVSSSSMILVACSYLATVFVLFFC